jgi:hypothetical protein
MVRAFAEEEDYVRAGRRAAGSGGAGRTGSGAAWCRVEYGCGLCKQVHAWAAPRVHGACTGDGGSLLAAPAVLHV